ncbi:MAG: flagellar hook assembly protein FlgD [bacterium]
MQASRLLESTVAPSANETISKIDSLNKDDFLKLLLTQMQHQDPLNPMDNTEFVSQLSQFSQLEQMYNVNQGLETLADSQNSIYNSLLANLLGKTARIDATKVYLKDQSTVNLNYELADSANRVTVKIFDSDGREVRTIEKPSQDSGMQTIEWDGKGDKGKDLPEGTYTVEITAYSRQGKTISLTPYLIDEVKEVIFTQGGDPSVKVAEQTVPISRILQVSENEKEESSAALPPEQAAVEADSGEE